MAIKNKLEELIASVHQCTTKDGVVEIERLYTQKKKELGANITPMMDIRVRDAIRGKISKFERDDHAAKESSALKKKRQEAEEIAAKLDEGLFVVSEKQFFEHETLVDECAIDAACIMDVESRIPTMGTKELSKTLSEACEHVGAHGLLYVPESKSSVLSLDEQIKIIKTFSDVDVHAKGVMFSEVEDLISKGVTRVFALVEEEKIAEYRRLGRHFLRMGGLRFEIVEVKNKVPSRVVEEMIRSDNISQFFENMPLPIDEAERVYDQHLERLMEQS